MVAFLRKHDCKEELKESNLKATPARIGVMRFLESVDQPADANTVLGDLKDEGIHADPATIYRILDLLYKRGLIQKIELGEGKYRYEKSQKHHHHLICTNCGRIQNVEGEFLKKMENEIYSDKKFKVNSHSLEFFGLCQDCQK
jgi:Fe2+ or Zn2+ uptake regulation protein